MDQSVTDEAPHRMSPQTLAWLHAQHGPLAEVAAAWLAENPIHQPAGSRAGVPRVGELPLRRVQAAAAAGAPVAVLRNLVHHQVALGARGWAHRASAEALIKLLDREVGERSGAAQEADRPLAEAALAASLMGALLRDYLYACARAGTVPGRRP